MGVRIKDDKLGDRGRTSDEKTEGGRLVKGRIEGGKEGREEGGDEGRKEEREGGRKEGRRG